jgi:maltooligosyltrehalose trehalohydrolase
MLAWYRTLIALRRTFPDLSDPDLSDVKVAHDEGARWFGFRRGDVCVALNLGKETASIPVGVPHARVLASWDPVPAPGADGVLTLGGESCVVLTVA